MDDLDLELSVEAEIQNELSSEPVDLEEGLCEELRSSEKRPGDGTTESPSGCVECRHISYNVSFYKAFGIAVCNKCQHELREKYKLVSQTTAKDQYMLTSSEVKALRMIERPNPRKPTWSAMKLYLLSDVLAIASNKLQLSGKLLEEELQKRRTSRDLKKIEKHMVVNKPKDVALPYSGRKKRKKSHGGTHKDRDNGVKSKRKKPKESPKKQVDSHEHEFSATADQVQQCKHCGITLEFEIL